MRARFRRLLGAMMAAVRSLYGKAPHYSAAAPSAARMPHAYHRPRNAYAQPARPRDVVSLHRTEHMGRERAIYIE